MSECPKCHWSDRDCKCSIAAGLSTGNAFHRFLELDGKRARNLSEEPTIVVNKADYEFLLAENAELKKERDRIQNALEIQNVNMVKAAENYDRINGIRNDLQSKLTLAVQALEFYGRTKGDDFEPIAFTLHDDLNDPEIGQFVSCEDFEYIDEEFAIVHGKRARTALLQIKWGGK